MGLKVKKTRPLHPNDRRQGKAEWFINTLLDEWA
jgi:hypothetical protein